MLLYYLVIILGIFIIYISLNGLSTKEALSNPIIIDDSSRKLPESISVEDGKVIIFNMPKCKEGSRGNRKRAPWEYSDYETIYQKTVNHWPGESIRF